MLFRSRASPLAVVLCAAASGTPVAQEGHQVVNSIVLSRRRFMGAAAFVPVARQLLAANLSGPLTPEARRRLVFERRDASARAELGGILPTTATNGDEDAYVDRRASFSKTLRHNDLGEVQPGAYRQWLAILNSGDPAQFDSVPRFMVASARLSRGMPDPPVLSGSACGECRFVRHRVEGIFRRELRHA